jgi:hypothetical protein
MRALSIRQPFAELILRGIKTVGYRWRPLHSRCPCGSLRMTVVTNARRNRILFWTFSLIYASALVAFGWPAYKCRIGEIDAAMH